jgi:RNA polymerase sigma factor (sigma-70 family)
MGTPRRDDPATDPASSGPGGVLSFPVQRAFRLTVVPFDPDRAAASAEDWTEALRRVAESQDRDAFGRLFAHFAPRVKSFLIRTGSTDELAEELAQEALVTVWRKATLFDPARAAVSTWIFTIARNLRVDAARRRRLDTAGDECFDFDVLESDQAGAGEGLDATRMARRVRDAINRLPPEQAQVLRLSFYDDEPHAHIAAELGIPLGTVKSRVRLAMAHLRRLLDL